ncbi:hypothetical protein DICPUDRAFT_88482 [Dictyostelium purpureum]|uniref:ditrans,polycis-polyprenyl diphosphate synthase [(2E,6E)-farnesyldiphosphate specific] n=1 Tax=Dictyostelium purpureum TaxID=5786 RepID=F0ZPP3_DICPU|nr:uncharacterized protein DICPUDRAFT_88482 [Dictyostelium purpureum]EGC34097.1 hypothetical protein DICPUDRAFT_88482 [Dictyostelium purpureum]|eukprot:XP_003289390.1 hypothetical protein DICPUDRAFT_88482 [Dictyostelium purpureum]
MYRILGYLIYNITFRLFVLIKILNFYYQLISYKIRNIISQFFMYLYIKSPKDYIEFINSSIIINNNNNNNNNSKNHNNNDDNTKIPKHLALILNHKDQSKSIQSNQDTLSFYNKLSEIIIWSHIIGVNRITILDNHGSLKKNISTFQNILDNNIKPFNNFNNDIIYSFKWLNNNKNINSDNDNNNNNDINKNNKIKNRVLTLSVATVDDGKQELINITKKYIKQSKTNQNLELNESFVNSNLPNYIGGINFEPEVALDFSDKQLFSGFLPWHVKLTEFIKVDHFHQFYFERYCQFLKRYGNIKKRCGK